MTTTTPPPSSEENLVRMAARVAAMQKEFPKSLLKDLDPTQKRAFIEEMAKEIPPDAPRDKFFGVALRVGGWHPHLYTIALPGIKELSGSELHELSNGGVVPFRRRGAKS